MLNIMVYLNIIGCFNEPFYTKNTFAISPNCAAPLTSQHMHTYGVKVPKG